MAYNNYGGHGASYNQGTGFKVGVILGSLIPTLAILVGLACLVYYCFFRDNEPRGPPAYFGGGPMYDREGPVYLSYDPQIKRPLAYSTDDIHRESMHDVRQQFPPQPQYQGQPQIYDDRYAPQPVQYRQPMGSVPNVSEPRAYYTSEVPRPNSYQYYRTPSAGGHRPAIGTAI